jgi:stage II sporulation protein D
MEELQEQPIAPETPPKPGFLNRFKRSSTTTAPRSSTPPRPTRRWLKLRKTGRWITRRPWLALPLLAILPGLAFTLDRNRPPEAKPVAEVLSPLRSPLPTIPLANGLPLPLPGQQPTQGLALPSTPSSPIASKNSLVPVDLTKLTPEQKAMNAKAKTALLGAAALTDTQIEMKVAIATKAPALAIGSPAKAQVSDDKGKVLYSLAAGEIYTAQADGGGISIGDQSLPGVVVINPNESGVFFLSGKPYRGQLTLVAKEGKLWAINYVNMRNYLQSVVASEVSPSWSPAALQAQSVAARSYALTYYFKPANPLYHLGNDEYFQVYSGIEREAQETNQAVDQTSGEYVSYKGGIVESLYAASDDIVAEAFAGKGMSQLGAKDMATQGANYKQILSHYYPTTAVAKIVQEF